MNGGNMSFWFIITKNTLLLSLTLSLTRTLEHQPLQVVRPNTLIYSNKVKELQSDKIICLKSK